MADQLKNKFLELTRMKYIDQAKWYLNGFWTEGAEQESETIWKFVQKFIELDDKKKKEGCELDEFQAHKFLESLGETLTVVSLREKLRKIDLDCNGKMALLEYLCFKYSKSVKQIIEAPQGDNQDEINEAAEKLQAVQDALMKVQTQLEQQQIALKQQKVAEDHAKKAKSEATNALDQQKSAEDAVRRSEAELRAAVDDLKNQEDSFNRQIQTLDQKSKDPSSSIVAKSKAAAELAQLKQENPLPLRKAKITQEAALRKVEKERKAAEAATAIAEAREREAEAAASEAESKRLALEEQTRRVEEAVRDTEARVQEALDYLEEVKKKGGVAHGAIWWMERELKEAQKYLPKNKQTK